MAISASPVKADITASKAEDFYGPEAASCSA